MLIFTGRRHLTIYQAQSEPAHRGFDIRAISVSRDGGNLKFPYFAD
jgi:hypothetical protein